MVEINIVYQGDLRCEAVHGPSGAVIATDAPKDNHGKGESFSPTDSMAIVAKPLNEELRGAKMSVRKEMVATPTRRIGALTVVIDIPFSPTPEQKQKLEEAAFKCPVHKSMHPDVQMPIDIRWA
jgi:putative redox protein